MSNQISDELHSIREDMGVIKSRLDKLEGKKNKDSIKASLLWALVGFGTLFMIYELYISLKPLMDMSINLQ